MITYTNYKERIITALSSLQWRVVLMWWEPLLFGMPQMIRQERKRPKLLSRPYDTIIIKKGCGYVFSPDPVKKLKDLLGNGDGEAADEALVKMLDSWEVLEVVNPRFEVKIIDRTMAPIFKIETGSMEAWTLAGCVAVVQ